MRTLLLGHPKAIFCQVELAIVELLLTEQVLPPCDHLNLLQFVNIFLVLRGLKLDAALQVGSNESQVKAHHQVPQSAGCAPVNTVHDAHPLCCFVVVQQGVFMSL